MQLRIGISPCPNDTFIFEHLVTKNISLNGIEFQFILEDVQTLNTLALANELDIVKISYANYCNTQSHYNILRAGGALGKGVGPLLISKTERQLTPQTLIAIPGKHTTANFLMQFALPTCTNKKEFIFSDIEQAILRNEVEAGVIIHENRFTYEQKGLHKIMDLGDYWETKTNLPIPLGGIAIKKDIPITLQHEINDAIIQSILLSKKSYPTLSNFVKTHAQEMSEDVMKQHIDLYVNEYSLDIGKDGEKAIAKMMELMLV